MWDFDFGKHGEKNNYKNVRLQYKVASLFFFGGGRELKIYKLSWHFNMSMKYIKFKG